jgi:thiamine-monophosphate kinase
MAFENTFLDWVRAQQRRSDTVLLPASDDLAILRFSDGELVLPGIDQVLDGVHFDLAACGPEAAGRKAMNRNLSDCAAMACLPAAALVSVALPRGTSLEAAQAIYAGARDAGERFDLPDRRRRHRHVGRAAVDHGRRPRPVRGRRARPPQWRARLATAFTSPARSAAASSGGTCRSRRACREARALVAAHVVTAMMDLSDGLAADLPRLCAASNVGAVLDAAAVPVHADVARHTDGRSPLDHAVGDGEDYELLFTAPGPATPPGVIRVGTIVEGEGVWLDYAGRREPLRVAGYEHV